ncbi:MAG: dihydropteroate synthase [Bacteroidales bacterium]|nr:dihydropteroate synthase [Bacteroidales bacterium]
MVQWMGIINLTPDSFFAPSRVWDEERERYPAEALERASAFAAKGASIIDLGAVSTRPGASDVPVEEEWSRLEPVLRLFARQLPDGLRISIDTTSAEIVRRAYDVAGPFIVNDISAGEDDPGMLGTVGELGLAYVAMHKRGNPRTMDSLADYPHGIIAELVNYFEKFARQAEQCGIADWILDPGLGFAKTSSQNWEILRRLQELKVFGRPILIGAADKRFTCGRNDVAHRLAIEGGADILRVHEIPEKL